MATSCEAAQTVWAQLPQTPVYGSIAALYPGDWQDLGLATMSTMLALSRGFAGWYATPTDGCPVTATSAGIDVSLANPYEDAQWRLAAVLALWSYIETAQGADGIQALADYLFGSDRAILRAAIATEDDSSTKLAWLRIVLTVGIVGVQEPILQIAEQGGLETITAGADLVLANWLPTSIDDATLSRAANAARLAMSPGPDAEALQRAGTALLARVQFIQAQRAGNTSVTPPPPIPPTAIDPEPSSWWSTAWPVVAGGAGGALIFALAWLRKRRRIAAAT